MPRRDSETPPNPADETDARFPSGAWTGFFLQPALPGRHWMELSLTFRNGVVVGEGRDRVGKFLIKGRYEVKDGSCHWTKSYIQQHSIHYRGYNEGKGIWGGWEFASHWKGGFHIWPEGMGDPSAPSRAEEIDEPQDFFSFEDAPTDEALVTLGR